MTIIGLVGFAGSGKDTVANILNDVHQYKKLAFADTLKDAASIIFDWPRYLLEGDTEPSRTFRERPDPYWSEKFGQEFTPRMALQQLGTEACRKTFHEDIWVLNLEKRISQYKNVVITDARFSNEIDFVKRIGGFVVRVKRGPEPVWYHTAYNHLHKGDYQMYKKYPDVHLSEWSWIGHSGIDMTIENKGSIDDLRNNVKNLLQILTSHDTLIPA